MGRVLIIDDEPLMCEMLSELLRSANHEVAIAQDGRSGVDLQKSVRAQVIVTDIMMPEKDGLEVILELRKEQPSLKIIAISGGSRVFDRDFLDIASKLGADAILKKPFSNEEFMSAVEACLQVEDTNGEPH